MHRGRGRAASHRLRSVLGGVLSALVVACTRQPAADAVPLAATLTGSGATFPYPVYTRWFSRFAEASGTRINYHSVGSSAGLEALVKGTTDFAATEVPPTGELRSALAAQQVRVVPMLVGGVALTYNLPGLRVPLRLDGAVLASILLGDITRWNDPRLLALNPDALLPNQPVKVVTRADASGTTWIVTDYLSRVSPAWAAGPGRGTAVRWPVGTPVRGNEGVAGEVKASEYALGLVEAVYAYQNRLPVARLRNHAGSWVTPEAGALRAAATAMLPSIDDTTEFATSINDAPGERSYPIASFTWLVVPTAGRAAPTHAAMQRFVAWALTEGDADALALGFAPLPAEIRARVVRPWLGAPAAATAR